MSDGLCSKNIDAVKISSPFAGMGFISPEFYREFELPFIKQLAESIKMKGKFVYLHTCGHINDRLHIMLESGISGLECLDPPPIGNVDLEEAFKKVGDSLFIKGNIDSVNTLLHGSEEQIMDDVSKRLSIGKKYPGFILSTACSIAPGVQAKNLLMLASIIEKEGYY
jgi:uroporphyrinogen decarboxylase